MLKLKSYHHTVSFSCPMPEGNPFAIDHPLHELHCENCMGMGSILKDLGPGMTFQFPLPECRSCSGKGKQALPPSELGL